LKKIRKRGTLSCETLYYFW